VPTKPFFFDLYVGLRDVSFWLVVFLVSFREIDSFFTCSPLTTLSKGFDLQYVITIFPKTAIQQ
jgi:hypothetical protein